MTNRKSQRTRVLELLQERRGQWVPLPELVKISCQYGARVMELRRAGYTISLIRKRVFFGAVRFLAGVLGVPAPSILPRGFARVIENGHEIFDNTLWVKPHCPLCGVLVEAGLGEKFGNQYQCRGCAASVNIHAIADADGAFVISIDPQSAVWDHIAAELSLSAIKDSASVDALAQGTA